MIQKFLCRKIPGLVFRIVLWLPCHTKAVKIKPVGVVVKGTANCAGGLGFDSWAGQSDSMSPKTRHRCDVFFRVVLRRH